LCATDASGEELLHDPLDGGTSGAVDGGSFEADGGWRAPRQIRWDVGRPVTSGGMSVTVRNWDPSAESSQHHHDKQQIINMFEGENCDQKWHADRDLSYFNIRTGSSYNDLFKFLADGGVERLETRLSPPAGAIDTDRSYVISVEWNASAQITVSLDGLALHTFDLEGDVRLRTVCIGSDDTSPGVYGPQHDVIYSDLRVWSDGAAVPDVGPDAGGEPDIGSEPDVGEERLLSFGAIADTFVDPGRPTTALGSDTELRTGSDGRTIFMAFDVAGVEGTVLDARIVLEALNAGGGGDLRAASGGWSEASLTFDSATFPSGVILDSLGHVDIGGSYEFDVTDAIAGNGRYDFAIGSLAVDGSGYHSRESATGAGPELSVTYAPSTDGPDVGGRDLGRPDADLPDLYRPDGDQPDSDQPDVIRRDVSHSDLTAPDLAVQDIAGDGGTSGDSSSEEPMGNTLLVGEGGCSTVDPARRRPLLVGLVVLFGLLYRRARVSSP